MTAALEGGEWSAARPGRTLPPGKTQYPFYRRLGGPRGRSGRADNLVFTGIRSQTVQPVTLSLYWLSYRAHVLHNIKPLFGEHVYEFSQRMWAQITKLNFYSVRWISVGKSTVRAEVVYFVNVFSSSSQISGQYVILVKTVSFHIPSNSSLTNLPFYIAWATNSLVKWTIRYTYLSDTYLQNILLADLRVNGGIILKAC